nr:MAG TPA: hypothetical protein [Caudoviricetes sp.]
MNVEALLKKNKRLEEELKQEKLKNEQILQDLEELQNVKVNEFATETFVEEFDLADEINSYIKMKKVRIKQISVYVSSLYGRKYMVVFERLV